MNRAIPDEASQMVCPRCGGSAYQNPNFTSEVREEDGRTSVSLHCQDGCDWRGMVFSWTVSSAEYQQIFGHPLPVPAGEEPTPPEARVLPPGPWGVVKLEPSPIPDEAWEMTCTNKVGRWRKKTCGAYVNPRPDHVFYYDEFTSSATVGYERCPRCEQFVLNHFSWQLTPEQHYAIFRRSPVEYVPSYDPDDPDDFEAVYSLWRTADRGMLQHFRDLDDVLECEDVDLLAAQAGEWTIRHWPSGEFWDATDFVAQNKQAVLASYDEGEGPPQFSIWPTGDRGSETRYSSINALQDDYAIEDMEPDEYTVKIWATDEVLDAVDFREQFL